MPQIGTWLLAHVFSALLPPVNPEDRDYYDILEVPTNATNEQIRKAYKVKSLKLHPDKVAQRRGNAEEAAREYEQVQEAYAVLVNDEKRQRYHALQCSPTRYRFIAQGAMSSPGALYENLTGASMMDKTRLVGLCTLIIILLLVQPILIATKVNHILERSGGLEDADWIMILIPFWCIGGIFILFWALMLGLAPAEARTSVIFTILEYSCWYVGVLCLCLRWDNDWSSSYAKTMIPIYSAMAFRWIQSIFLMQKVRSDVERMVTVHYLETKVLIGMSLEGMTEQEQEDLRKEYFVVTVPPDFVPQPAYDEDDTPLPLDEQAIEDQKVAASPEYEAATEIYNSTLGSLTGSLIFGLAFLILLTRKLDGNIDASYWTVFTPIWVSYGSRWIYNCFHCLCAQVTGEEIMLQMPDQEKDGDEQTEEKQDDTKGEDKGQSGQAPTDNDTENDRPTDNLFVGPTAGMSMFRKGEDTPQNVAASGNEFVASSNTSEPNQTGATTDESKGGEDEDKVPSDDDKEDNAERIHIDEETFRAWQSAYEEAERGAMEQQAKASMECCNLTFQIMLLLMLVAKIEDNFDGDDDIGFNSFWMLFPFFILFGVVICCCACLIYGAAPGTAEDLNGLGGMPPADEAADVETPIVIPPAEPPNTAEKNETATTNIESSPAPAAEATDNGGSSHPSDESPAPSNTPMTPATENIDDLD